MATTPAPASPFAFFVQSVPPNEQGEHGHVVPRFGVADAWLGVRRAVRPPPRDGAEAAAHAFEERARLLRGKPKGHPGWVWSEEPEGITHAEYVKHRREYEQMFADGSLKKLSPEEAAPIAKKLEDDRAAKRAELKKAEEERLAAEKAEAEKAEKLAKAEAEKAEKAAKAKAEEKQRATRTQATEESGR